MILVILAKIILETLIPPVFFFRSVVFVGTMVGDNFDSRVLLAITLALEWFRHMVRRLLLASLLLCSSDRKLRQC